MSEPLEVQLSENQEQMSDLEEEEKNELISMIRQLLEDCKANDSKSSLFDQLQAEFGDRFVFLSNFICSVNRYKNDIDNEIQNFIKENRDDDNSNDSNPSLDTVYFVSNELAVITGKSECNGKEVGVS